MNEETKNPVEETVETPVTETVEAPAEETAEAAKEPKKAKKNAKADALAAELEAAKAEAAKTKDLFLRTAAEYDNYRKRTTKEREAAFGNGVAHAVEKLLPVIDTLEMAAAAATADENYKKGVTMTLTKAYAVLKDMGVEEIPAQDQPFDPNVHSAMMQQPTEGVEAGIVVQVFQKGYTLNGRVIRHAMVVVSA
jgi:molecular chaperone GrpE